MDFFDHWLRMDKWTFIEAALLLNGIDPNNVPPVRPIVTWGHQAQGLPLEDYGKNVSLTYQVLSRVLWNKYDSSALKSESTFVDNYFQVAQEKKLNVNESLQNKWIGFRNENNRNNAVSDKMIETIYPLIVIIEDFKNCDEFKKRKQNIKQERISEWLEDRGLTMHLVRTLKHLISVYYDISKSRS